MPGILLTLTALLFIGWLILDWYLGQPNWRVKYPPEPKFNFKGGYSVWMSYRIACDYASIFNGEVIKHNEMDEAYGK